MLAAPSTVPPGHAGRVHHSTCRAIHTHSDPRQARALAGRPPIPSRPPAPPVRARDGAQTLRPSFSRSLMNYMPSRSSPTAAAPALCPRFVPLLSHSPGHDALCAVYFLPSSQPPSATAVTCTPRPCPRQRAPAGVTRIRRLGRPLTVRAQSLCAVTGARPRSSPPPPRLMSF